MCNKKIHLIKYNYLWVFCLFTYNFVQWLACFRCEYLTNLAHYSDCALLSICFLVWVSGCHWSYFECFCLICQKLVKNKRLLFPTTQMSCFIWLTTKTKYIKYQVWQEFLIISLQMFGLAEWLQTGWQFVQMNYKVLSWDMLLPLRHNSRR